MSSSFIKVREEAQKKREKDYQKLRTDVAVKIAVALANAGHRPHELIPGDSVKLADALLAKLGYNRPKVESSASDE